MVKRFNLSEAAKEILDANVVSKRAQDHDKGVGNSTLNPSVGYGTQDAGKIGDSPEKENDDLPDYTKGVGKATPPGATPPVGSEKDGAGITRPQGQPQETQGRADLAQPVQADMTSYDAIRDRIAGKLPPQTMPRNPGSTFQAYESADMSADVDALLEGESLSPEFKQKATTIFEAAVNARVAAIVEEIQTDFQAQFEEAYEELQTELAEKVDEYLNYMVNEWIEENQVAIEKGLRAEIAEEFMEGLRNLFMESYIDIPEDKVDVVEELASRVEELEEAYNDQLQKNVAQAREINEHKKISSIHAACEGLTQTQVEKLKALAEGVEFTTEDEFVGKLETLKESYFPTDVKKGSSLDLTEDLLTEETPGKSTVSSDPEMDVYAKTISKTLIK